MALAGCTSSTKRVGSANRSASASPSTCPPAGGSLLNADAQCLQQLRVLTFGPQASDPAFARCPVNYHTPGAVPAVPPGRHAEANPQAALREAITHVAGSGTTLSQTGWDAGRTEADGSVMFAHRQGARVGARVDYVINVERTASHAWFESSFSSCL